MSEDEFLKMIKTLTKPVKYIQGKYEKVYISEPFDMKKHKDNFFNYLEVIITKDGEIKYAVPDHKNAILNYANLNECDCPENRRLDCLDWLMEESGCICVYTDNYLGKPNRIQINKLEILKEYGLYLGEII